MISHTSGKLPGFLAKPFGVRDGGQKSMTSSSSPSIIYIFFRFPHLFVHIYQYAIILFCHRRWCTRVFICLVDGEAYWKDVKTVSHQTTLDLLVGYYSLYEPQIYYNACTSSSASSLLMNCSRQPLARLTESPRPGQNRQIKLIGSKGMNADKKKEIQSCAERKLIRRPAEVTHRFMTGMRRL